MPTLVPAYTIREELSVSQEVERATQMHPLAESIFDAAKWRIAREPDCGRPLEGIDELRRVLHLPPNRDARTPGLLVRYVQVSRDVISVEWVHFYPYDAGAAVSPAAYVS